MEAMIVQGTALQVKEYKGKRVVTFKDIDTVHKRPDGTARRNFNQNRQRFISGVDFFKVCADEIRTHKIAEISPKSHEPLTLITETGYLMLVKSFTDDLAWKVQRELVDSYFRIKQVPIEPDVEQKNVIDTEKLIQIGSIMAGCLEGNRPYVLNIFKNIIPNIDDVFSNTEESHSDIVKEISVKCELPVKRKKNTGADVFFDFDELDRMLKRMRMTRNEFCKKVGLCSSYFYNMEIRNSFPSYSKRKDICDYFGVDYEYFNFKH